MIDALGTGPVTLTIAATLLLAVGGLASVLARRQAAALRHLIWVSTFVGLLALPLLHAAGPSWSVPVLPAEFGAVERGAEREAPVVGASGEFGEVFSADPAAEGPPAPSALEGGRGEVLVRSDAALKRARLLGPVVLGWVAGSAAVGFWVLMGQLGVMRLRRRARPAADRAWLETTREFSGRLNLSRPVDLVFGEDTWTPMTWGLVRPTIFLPGRAREWSEERRRMVLLHELAHVKRRDCLTQLIAQLGCALFWFHPLAWHAARRLRVERERACDDLVVRTVAPGGTPATDYAQHLLEIARALRAPRVAGGGVAMAIPSQLEGRLLAVLDPDRRRTDPPRAATWCGIGLALALALPLAAIEPGPAPARSALEGPRASAQGSGLEWDGELAPGTELAVHAAHGPIEAAGVPGRAARVVGYATDLRPGQEPVRLETLEEPGRVVICLVPRGARCTLGGIVGLADDVPATAGRAEVVVLVPDGVSLHAGSDHGSLELEGIRGDVSAVTRLGSILASADGAVRARTGNGAIDVTMGRTDWTGELALESGGGQVQLRLPPWANTRVAARTGSGGVISEFPMEVRTTADGGGAGEGTLGLGGRELTAFTANGRIAILRADRGQQVEMERK